jgi:guanylate kinase
MELTESANTSAGKVTPHLKHVDEFNTVLQEYHVGAQAQRILDETKFVVLVGPSSSGRNTIISKLLKTGKYHFIVSDTTRPPRLNNSVPEQDGVHYWFRKESDFLTDLKQGKYLEAEVIHGQQVSGLSVRELEKARDNDKIAITDIDIGGVYNVVQVKPDTAVILILPPNFGEWKRRLLGRSTMHDDEYRRRMKTALRIFSAPAEHAFFNVVINDTLEDAVQQVDDIAHGIVDAGKQANGSALAQQLLADLQAELVLGV